MQSIERKEGRLLRSGQPCSKCGGSDPLALYENENEAGEKYVSGYCFSNCGYLSPRDLGEDYPMSMIFDETDFYEEGVMQEELDNILELNSRGWKERYLKKATHEFYGVKMEFDDDGQAAFQYTPVTEDGELVGFHKRNCKEKKFSAVGRNKVTSEFFGQSLFSAGGKYLVITGGQNDAMSVYQTLFDSSGYKNACISPTCGEPNAAKQLQNNYEYVSSFEKVILMMDNDAEGEKAAMQMARLLKPGQAYVATFNESGCKDPNDYIMRGKQKQLIDAFWKASKYSPVDVLHLEEMWDDFENEDSNAKIPFPDSWSTLNEMLGGGGELGEITVIGSLTSIGKSTIINNIVYHLIENTDFKVGAMYLEGTKREVVRDLLGLDMSINLRHKDRQDVDMKSLKERFFGYLAAKDQFCYVDHQGSISNKEIFDKLRYLVKGEGCNVIVLDPLQAAVNSSENGAIINFMDTLLKFAKETNTYIIVVSHMKKPSGDDPHDVSEYDLMGSSSINQIAFNTILLSRDKMSDDPKIRNATKLQAVKCRRTGTTGNAGWLRYDNNTTHMYATADPYADHGETISDGDDSAPDVVPEQALDFSEFEEYGNVG